MSARPVTPPLRRVRWPLTWLLVLALAVYGVSGTLAQVLGPAHRHVAPATAGPLVGHPAAARSAAHDLALHVLARGHARAHDPRHDHAHRGAHAHDTTERHLHALDDPTVRAFDAAHGDVATEAATKVSSGSAHLALALAPRPLTLGAAAARAGWTPGGAVRWTDAPSPRAKRPPRG